MPQIEQQTTEEIEGRLRPLLDHLASCVAAWGGAAAGQASPHTWHGWEIAPIGGGANGRLFRAQGSAGDLAVKYTMRDGRDRAGREYAALRALAQAGLDLAPRALLLDRDAYPQPVVVQTWLEGEASERLPEGDNEWQALIEHLVRVHGVTPGRVEARQDGVQLRPDGVQLRPAIIDARTAAQARACVREQVARLPRAVQPEALQALVGRMEATKATPWPQAPVVLCRLDHNLRNYIRRPSAWASVDWEYSGWGDPAWDLAQWMAHASYVEVPQARWPWAVQAYARRAAERGREDATLELRVRTYTQLLLVWWVARLVRYRVEVPAGLDARLAGRPEDWEENIRRKYAHYVGRVEQMWGG